MWNGTLGCNAPLGTLLVISEYFFLLSSMLERDIGTGGVSICPSHVGAD